MNVPGALQALLPMATSTLPQPVQKRLPVISATVLLTTAIAVTAAGGAALGADATAPLVAQALSATTPTPIAASATSTSAAAPNATAVPGATSTVTVTPSASATVATSFNVGLGGSPGSLDIYIGGNPTDVVVDLFGVVT